MGIFANFYSQDSGQTSRTSIFSLVIGGQTIFWNEMLSIGIWGSFSILIIVSANYLCLSLSYAEMISGLPFSGGVYGLTRVTLGSFIGYIVACCEAAQTLLYASLLIFKLAECLGSIFLINPDYLPLIWLAITISTVSFHSCYQKSYWVTFFVLSAVNTIIYIVYFVGSSPSMRFSEYQPTSLPSNYAFNFVKQLPLACLLFLGVECIPVLSKDLSKPTVYIPKIMTICTLIGVIIAFALLLSLSSLSPGLEKMGNSTDYPFILSPGFAQLFGLSTKFHSHSYDYTSLANIFTLPALFGSVFAFNRIYTRQLSSISMSGLFPKLFTHLSDSNEVSYGAIIFGCLFPFVLLLILWSSFAEAMQKFMIDVCLISSCFVYLAIFYCYIKFRNKYSILERVFRNPLGTYIPATFGIGSTMLILISLIGFQRDGFVAIIVFIVYLIIMVVYYNLVAKKRQFFSHDEQTVLIAAYIINANSRSHKKSIKHDSFRNRSLKGVRSPHSFSNKGSHKSSTSISLQRQYSSATRSVNTTIRSAGTTAPGIQSRTTQSKLSIDYSVSEVDHLNENQEGDNMNKVNVGMENLSHRPHEQDSRKDPQVSLNSKLGLDSPNCQSDTHQSTKRVSIVELALANKSQSNLVQNNSTLPRIVIDSPINPVNESSVLKESFSKPSVSHKEASPGLEKTSLRLSFVNRFIKNISKTRSGLFSSSSKVYSEAPSIGESSTSIQQDPFDYASPQGSTVGHPDRNHSIIQEKKLLSKLKNTVHAAYQLSHFVHQDQISQLLPDIADDGDFDEYTGNLVAKLMNQKNDTQEVEESDSKKENESGDHLAGFEDEDIESGFGIDSPITQSVRATFNSTEEQEPHEGSELRSQPFNELLQEDHNAEERVVSVENHDLLD